VKRIIAAALVILATPASGQDDSKSYDRAVDGVVWICAIDKAWEESHGSGVVLGDGLILTAFHVVRSEVLVWAHSATRKTDGSVDNSPSSYRSKDATSMRCVVIASDPKRDLALLKVKHGEKKGRPITLAAKSPSPGEAVFTIGNGDKVLFRYSGGNVRQVYVGEAWFLEQEVWATMIDFTAAINFGDSGGPVINSRGEVVGINSYIDAGMNQVHMAVDVSEIKAFLNSHARAEKAKPLW
jgi:S1-C subfamily serine protease